MDYQEWYKLEEYFNKQTLNFIDLQWFAAEDEGRTEEPTEHKLRKAREEGKVAKSVELSSTIVLLAGIIALALLSHYIFQSTQETLRFFFNNSTSIDITSNNKVLMIFLIHFTRIVLPIMVVVFIAAFLGNVLQVGFLFTTKTITPDFTKIIPHFGRFFKKALFSGEAVFNLGKSIFKVIIITVIAYLNISMEIEKLINMIRVPFMQSFGFVSSIAFRIIVEAALAMLVLSLIDYFFQKKQHTESLKMSKQEIKEERKMLDGDPLVKSRLRERMRELLMRNMMKAVPQADVVVTNPTHYAIAMQWKRLIMQAPVVTAKGVDAVAHKIKELALSNQIPVVENKPLAQALYKEVEIGEAIPEKYYEVMATILAQVYKMNGRAKEAV